MKRARIAQSPLLLTLALFGSVMSGGSSSLAQAPDTDPPETTITFGPTGPSGADWAAFSFTSSESPSTFGCSVDGGTFGSCTSPTSVHELSDGAHTFRVRSTDAAGNTDPTPAERTWTIDTDAPDTTITSGPASPTQSLDAVVKFTGSEPGTTFQCSLDGAAFSGCSSPKQYGSLGDDVHTFRVRALDDAGNADPSPAEWRWTVDARGPQLAIEQPTSGLYVNDQVIAQGGSSTIVVGSVTVLTRANDFQSGVAILRFFVDGVGVDASKVTFQNGVYRFPFTPASPGEHIILASATNGSGLSSSIFIRVVGLPVGSP
jgi:hypothetical protein